MIYAIVLAGGIGKRMGSEKPKQFMLIGGKPIISHTVEKFMMCSEFEKIIVCCPRQWVEYTDDLLKKHIGENEKTVVISGGETRNETLMNAIKFIENEGNLTDETIIVTHDAVRPFVTNRIIRNNIEAAKLYGACDTAIPATDTIVKSTDKEVIDKIPNREYLFQGQTPQTFQAKLVKDIYESLTDEEKDILTDAAKILTMKGEKVHLVKGEVFNIKITYPYDIAVAETLLKGNDRC